LQIVHQCTRAAQALHDLIVNGHGEASDVLSLLGQGADIKYLDMHCAEKGGSFLSLARDHERYELLRALRQQGVRTDYLGGEAKGPVTDYC
jgi:hypothetical protein